VEVCKQTTLNAETLEVNLKLYLTKRFCASI
jgi:hypothetical protein